MAAAAAASPPAPGKIRDIFLARLADLEGRVERELDRAAPSVGPAGEFVLDLAREAWRSGAALLSSASTSAGRREVLAFWTAAAPVDELGMDAALAESVREIIRPLARRWLALGESRSAALPERGGVLILLNRSAWPLPVEALVLWSFLCDGRMGDRRVTVMWDHDLAEIPYLSDFARRIGLVAATWENAAALLERGAVVIAFPEGLAARTKTYDRRYRLARFDSDCVIGAAIEAGAHIVPGAVVGNEESYPLLGQVAGIPVTAQFPLLGLAGLLPLPRQWTLRLGAPIQYATTGAAGPDPSALADAVRARIQACLADLLARAPKASS